MSKMTNASIDRLEDLDEGSYVYRRAYRGSLYFNIELSKWQLNFRADPPSVQQQGGSVSCHRKELIDNSFGNYLNAFRNPLNSGEAICFDITPSIVSHYRAKAHPYRNNDPLDLAHAGIFACNSKQLSEAEMEDLIAYINNSDLKLV